MKDIKPKGWLIDDGFNPVYTEAKSNLSNAERFNWKITPLYESAGSKFPQTHTMQTKLDEQAKEIEALKALQKKCKLALEGINNPYANYIPSIDMTVTDLLAEMDTEQ